MVGNCGSDHCLSLVEVTLDAGRVFAYGLVEHLVVGGPGGLNVVK